MSKRFADLYYQGRNGLGQNYLKSKEYYAQLPELIDDEVESKIAFIFGCMDENTLGGLDKDYIRAREYY